MSTLKDNRRTYSGIFKYADKFFVFKISRSRNKRLWERLLSFFRGGDTHRIFKGMILLKKIEFEGPNPILFGERRKLGFTVDSFLVYEYLRGEKCNIGDGTAITSIMNNLHSRGYTRRDVNVGNFIKSADCKISFIDFRLTKPKTFKTFRINLERIQMTRNIPGSLEHIPFNEKNTLSFKIANHIYFIISSLRSIKRKLKNLFIPYTSSK
jgi:heptose II phosphotransferase